MLTQRLGSASQKNPAFIDGLIKEITAHKGCCDEVWFATDYGFPPLEKHRESARLIEKSAEKFRAAGIRVSLQLSNSIGHGQYMRSQNCTGLVYDGSPVRNMVDANGTEAGYCFCWNDSVFRDYTFSALIPYLKAVKPFCVWVDDDFRAVNHDPVSHGCFCDGCVSMFNSSHGTDFDREGLVEAIHSDIEIRRKHIEFLRSTLADFMYELGKVIHKELPECRMGLQGCANGGYTGFGTGFAFEAMKKATGFDPFYRAGGGAYNDYSPAEFIKKAAFISYQHYMLPDYVKDRRPEIESLPDVVFGKSIAGTCFETSCYLAFGSTAMSYAILMNDYEPMSWHGEMLSAFASHREYWEKLSAVSKRTTAAGLTPYFPKTAFLIKDSKNFDYSKEEVFFAEDLRYCAVPVAFTNKEASVYVINGRIAKTLNEKEIDYLLSKNVVCDGEAVEALHRRGYLPDVSAEEISVQGLYERFCAHPANSGFEGRTWGGQIWRRNDYRITGEKIEPVCEYFSKSSGSTESAGVSAAVFTTEKGAKWAAFGFDLWARTKSCEKRTQFLNVCEYISEKRFSAELTTPIQSCILPRENADGKCAAVSIINCTVGESGRLKIVIRNPESEEFTFMSQYLPETAVKSEKIADNEYEVEIPSISGWSTGTIFCK